MLPVSSLHSHLCHQSNVGRAGAAARVEAYEPLDARRAVRNLRRRGVRVPRRAPRDFAKVRAPRRRYEYTGMMFCYDKKLWRKEAAATNGVFDSFGKPVRATNAPGPPPPAEEAKR